MGHVTRAVTAAVLILGAAGCDDPFVFVGDAPGVARVVAGTPEQPGDSVADQAVESQLDNPLGLAVDAAGTLYIADSENARVLAVASSGAIEVLLDHRFQPDPRVRRPGGLALDDRGGLLISDPAGRRIWRLDLETGAAEPLAGTGLSGGVLRDTADALAAHLQEPYGLAVAADGTVLFSERQGNRVRRLEPGGGVETIAGTGNPGFAGDGGPGIDARLAGPAGLALSGSSLYIADSENHRIRRLDLTTGIIQTVAGTGDAGFAGDGSAATDALLNGPAGLAVAPDGSLLFVADALNNRIRVVSLAGGTINTFAGTGDPRFRGDQISAGQVGLAAPQEVASSPFRIIFISDTGHHIVLRTSIGFSGTP